MEDQSSSGKTVIITGAAAGIGRATALRFARSGANILEAGGGALFQVVNVTESGCCRCRRK